MRGVAIETGQATPGYVDAQLPRNRNLGRPEDRYHRIFLPDPGQVDTGGDGIGDFGNADFDNDGVVDGNDWEVNPTVEAQAVIPDDRLLRSGSTVAAAHRSVHDEPRWQEQSERLRRLHSRAPSPAPEPGAAAPTREP